MLSDNNNIEKYLKYKKKENTYKSFTRKTTMKV